jgi:hypothetical protein
MDDNEILNEEGFAELWLQGASGIPKSTPNL